MSWAPCNNHKHQVSSLSTTLSSLSQTQLIAHLKGLWSKGSKLPGYCRWGSSWYTFKLAYSFTCTHRYTPTSACHFFCACLWVWERDYSRVAAFSLHWGPPVLGVLEWSLICPKICVSPYSLWAPCNCAQIGGRIWACLCNKHLCDNTNALSVALSVPFLCWLPSKAPVRLWGGNSHLW